MMRPRYDDYCTCGHLGIHHHYADDAPCLAKGGDCPCNQFTRTPSTGKEPDSE